MAGFGLLPPETFNCKAMTESGLQDDHFEEPDEMICPGND